MDDSDNSNSGNNIEKPPRQFYFWRIMFVCWAVVAFCALSAWIISTYFYE